MKLYFLVRFLKTLQMSNSMKIRPVGSQLLHVDGRTEKTKHKSRFRNFRTRLTTVNINIYTNDT